MSLLAGIDPDDVHFRIVRDEAPPRFESGNVLIEYAVGEAVYIGAGSAHATSGQIAAQMTYDDPRKPGETMRTFNAGTPGKLIAPNRYGTLSGTSADGRKWQATGAFIIGRSLNHPTIADVRFHLDSIVVYESQAEVAYTREVLIGPRLSFLSTCLWTPLADGGARADRIEEHVFSRRVTLRDLRTVDEDGSSQDNANQIAVVYDGSPLEGRTAHALWLAVSVLAGASLQPAVVETYDTDGSLISRAYRPGGSVGALGQPPFHVRYAPYTRGTLAALCEGIVERLEQDFPIDVVIAHIHDANDGSMVRRMQSYLFAIHAASEAWNRLFERVVVVDKNDWETLKHTVTAAARALADPVDTSLGDSISGSIMNANNTSTGARLRLFFSRIAIRYDGPDKKAVDLRNKLFHDGYLQRRFQTLHREERQERYDQQQRLRDFSLRMMLSLCGVETNIHSALNLYASIPVRDATDASRE